MVTVTLVGRSFLYMLLISHKQNLNQRLLILRNVTYNVANHFLVVVFSERRSRKWFALQQQKQSSLAVEEFNPEKIGIEAILVPI